MKDTAKWLSGLVNGAFEARITQSLEYQGREDDLDKVLQQLRDDEKVLYPFQLRDDTELMADTVGMDTFGRVISCNREDGIREIHATIGEQALERAWLYIPDESVWVDNAMKSSENEVVINTFVGAQLSYSYSFLEYINTHSEGSFDNNFIYKLESVRKRIYLHHTKPSDTDIRVSKIIGRESKPGHKSIHSFISHYGLTSYVTSSQIDLMEYMNQVPAVDANIDESIAPMVEIMEAFADLKQKRQEENEDESLSISFQPLR